MARCEKCNGCQSMWDVTACQFCGHVPTDRDIVTWPGVKQVETKARDKTLDKDLAKDDLGWIY